MINWFIVSLSFAKVADILQNCPLCNFRIKHYISDVECSNDNCKFNCNIASGTRSNDHRTVYYVNWVNFNQIDFQFNKFDKIITANHQSKRLCSVQTINKETIDYLNKLILLG